MTSMLMKVVFTPSVLVTVPASSPVMLTVMPVVVVAGGLATINKVGSAARGEGVVGRITGQDIVSVGGDDEDSPVQCVGVAESVGGRVGG